MWILWFLIIVVILVEATLAVLGFSRFWGKQQKPRYPYRRNKFFLNESEKKLFFALQEIARRKGLCVFSKIRMEDLLYVPQDMPRREGYGWRGRIKSRHIDFVMCDSRSLDPIVAIELDGSSHERRDRVERDDFVNDAFRDAGFPLLRISVQNFYNPDDISKQIEGMFQPKSSLDAVVNELQR